LTSDRDYTLSNSLRWGNRPERRSNGRPKAEVAPQRRTDRFLPRAIGKKRGKKLGTGTSASQGKGPQKKGRISDKDGVVDPKNHLGVEKKASLKTSPR